MSTNRREFLTSVAGACCCLLTTSVLGAQTAAKRTPESSRAGFSLKYLVASCMYGYMDLSTILPEVEKIGATAIDIWPKPHGNQREQLDEMGEERFAALLQKHNVKLGCITQYMLGPFNLKEELRLAERLGCQTMVTGSRGPKELTGSELKLAVKEFVEKMRPQIEVAEETGVTIAIENHSSQLINSAEAFKWLLEFRPSKHLGVALAPYHLPQDEKLLSDIIRFLGENLTLFYAWQYGMGSREKENEIMQMPGRGPLDFRPLLSALRDINFSGWTEIFMHPVPRGVPILESSSAVTTEINRARDYINSCLKEI